MYSIQISFILCFLVIILPSSLGKAKCLDNGEKLAANYTKLLSDGSCVVRESDLVILECMKTTSCEEQMIKIANDPCLSYIYDKLGNVEQESFCGNFESSCNLDITSSVPFCNSSGCSLEVVAQYRNLIPGTCSERQNGRISSCSGDCQNEILTLSRSHCLLGAFNLLTSIEKLPFCYNFETQCGVDINHEVPDCATMLQQEEERYQSGVAIVISFVFILLLVGISVAFLIFYNKKHKEYLKYERLDVIPMEEKNTEEKEV